VPFCHSRVGGNLLQILVILAISEELQKWIPACAGMTRGWHHQSFYTKKWGGT
jgi:hypothetical protein